MKILAFLAALFCAGAAHATCSAVPFTFSAGTTALSSQVNSNFSALVSCVNAIDTGQITSGTLTTARGGTNHGNWTTGSILYASSSTGVSEDNTKLFWDATNKRLGLNTAAPIYLLDVNGNANANNWQLVGNATNASGTVGFLNANGPSILFHGSATAAASQMQFFSAGSQLAVLTSTIRLGVGVTNPTYTIDSAADINAAGIFRQAGTAGVNCAAGVTAATVTVAGGIVTHC